MVSKNSLLIYIFLFSLAALIFTAIFYIIQKPKIESYLQKKQTAAVLPKEAEKPFEPFLLSWTEATSSAVWQKRDSHAVVVFQNKMWLMGGLDGSSQVVKAGDVNYWNAPHFGDVWVSENGIDWNLVQEKSVWGSRRSIQVAAFKDKMWLIGGWSPKQGYQNDVWLSENGTDWTKAASSTDWPAREGHSLVIFKDKLWLIGGVRYDKRETKNDAWYSDDGTNWLPATLNAAWLPRWDHSVAVFNNKLWLIGGMDLNGRVFKDVWSSEDGINWILATDNPGWEARQGHNILEYKDKLWVLGRLNDVYNSGKNDVWFSDNGTDWQKTKDDPLWPGREDSAAVVFKDKIWVLGGMNLNWEWTNDIWYSTK